jgi:hypothetical protein
VEKNGAPEFDLGRPLGSAASVLRAIFTAPKRFFVAFSAEGPLREPALFVLLIASFGAAVRLLIEVIFSAGSLANVGVTVLEAVLYAALAPALVAVFAGAYLLSARTFLGPEAQFRGVYRMLAYAFGATIFAPIPGIVGLAFAYATFVLMILGFRYVYRASLMRAMITALVGFVPSAILYLILVVQVAGFTSTL